MFLAMGEDLDECSKCCIAKVNKKLTGYAIWFERIAWFQFRESCSYLTKSEGLLHWFHGCSVGCSSPCLSPCFILLSDTEGNLVLFNHVHLLRSDEALVLSDKVTFILHTARVEQHFLQSNNTASNSTVSSNWE